MMSLNMNKNNLVVPNNIISLTEKVELLRKNQVNTIDKVNEIVEELNDLTSGDADLKVKTLTAEKIDTNKGYVNEIDLDNEQSIPNIKYVLDVAASGVDPSKTLTLMNEGISLITYGNITVGQTNQVVIDKNGTITSNEIITNDLDLTNGTVSNIDTSNNKSIVNKEYVDTQIIDNVETIVNDVLSSGVDTLNTNTLNTNTLNASGDITGQNINASNELKGKTLNINDKLTIDENGYITGGKINQNVFNDDDIINKKYVDDNVENIVNNVLSSGTIETIQTQTLTSNTINSNTIKTQTLETQSMETKEITIKDNNNNDKIILDGESGNITASGELIGSALKIKNNDVIMLNIDSQGDLISKGNLTGEVLNGKSLVINNDKASIDNQGNLSINKGIINEIDLNNKKSIININYFDNNKGYYFVNSIVNTIEGQTDDLIFVINDNNDLTLYKKNDDDTYNIYNVNDGSLCIVNDNEEVYVKYKNENKQKWEKNK